MAIAVEELKVRMIGEPHSTRAPGTLHIWKVQKGQTVEAGDILATVRSADDYRGHVVRAAVSGVVRAILAPVGKKLAPGDVVCYVEAPSAPEAPLTAPAPRRSSYTNGTGKAPHKPTERPQQAITRRPAALPAVEELTLPEKVRAKQEPETVKHHTLHLAASQIEALRQYSYRLKLEQGAGAYSQSEIARAAIQLFLSMPEPARLDLLKVNREREEAGQWGAGFPRPGN